MLKSGLYLIPTTLGGESVNAVLPSEAGQIVTELRNFMVEDIKAARRFLRKVDREFPIDESQFFSMSKHRDVNDIQRCLSLLKQGASIGVLSDAGCPGIADPGAEMVAAAHQAGIRIFPLVGPSSILLTLMASGLSGQSFCFHGYLAKDRKDRVKQIKDFEMDTLRSGKTHLFMDTPFRNMNVLHDLLNELSDQTQLCIASNLTMHDEHIRTRSIKEWRLHAYDLSKKPAMFAIGKIQ